MVEESNDDDSKLKFIHIMIMDRIMALDKNKIITNQLIYQQKCRKISFVKLISVEDMVKTLRLSEIVKRV